MLLQYLLVFDFLLSAFLNFFQDGLFWGCSRMGTDAKRPLLPKICHTYPTMMKLGTVDSYINKIQNYLNHVTHSISFADMSIFSPEISNFCYIKKHICTFHFNTLFLILLTFFESLKVVLINMVATLMMSAKGLFKREVFWNKVHVAIIFVHNVTNKILPGDSNYNLEVVMRPKFGNSNISMRKVIITTRIWQEKPIFWGVLLVQVQ